MVSVTEVMDTQGWVSFSGARGSKAPKFGIFSFKQLLKPSPFSPSQRCRCLKKMPLPILKTRSPDWGLIQFPKLQQLTRNSENVSATLRLGGASLALGWAWAWWLGDPSFSEIWETTIWFLWALRESRYRRLSMSQLKIDGTGTGLQLPLGLDDNPLTNHQA